MHLSKPPPSPENTQTAKPLVLRCGVFPQECNVVVLSDGRLLEGVAGQVDMGRTIVSSATTELLEVQMEITSDMHVAYHAQL